MTVGDPVNYRRKHNHLRAVLFTGHNVSDIEAFADWNLVQYFGERSHRELCLHHAGEPVFLSAGHWIVEETPGAFDVYADDQFRRLFEPGRPA